jgi:hypothetical protein
VSATIIGMRLPGAALPQVGDGGAPRGLKEKSCEPAIQGSVANLADRFARCTFACNGFGGEHVMIEFKGSHFERDVSPWAVRWYVVYPISYRQLEEMMEEHGVEVDHTTLNRWVRLRAKSRAPTRLSSPTNTPAQRERRRLGQPPG